MRTTQELQQLDAADYLTVDEAANELGIKPTAIRNYLCDGKLTTYKLKTLTLLKREEVNTYRQERQT